MWLIKALHVGQNATTTLNSSQSSMFKHVNINKDNINIIKEIGILEHII